MKSLLHIALIGTAVLLSTNAIAARPMSQGQALGECKALASTQFDNVKKIRVAHMKTTRGTFKTKLRVHSASEKAMFLCTVEPNQDAQITRIDKNTSAIASKQ